MESNRTDGEYFKDMDPVGRPSNLILAGKIRRAVAVGT